MSAPFELSSKAIEDLDSIWWFIGQYNREAADRVETAIIVTCRRLAEYPLIGHHRRDVTSLPVPFWTLPRRPNYVIVYRPEAKPLQVIAILHWKQNMEEILKDRLPE